MKELSVITTPDFIATKIIFLREEKVLLDADLALLYGVETKRLKETVKRNIDRFPEDFMFQLSRDEWQNLRSQFASSSWGGTRYPPFAFTEQGVAMLSGILNSPRAVETNIAIMPACRPGRRTFVALRKLMETNKDLAAKIRHLEKKYDQRFKLVFDAIQKLIKQEKESRPIGFEIGKKK
jgi:hypothetical protein